MSGSIYETKRAEGMRSWRQMITIEMNEHGDSWLNVESIAIDADDGRTVDEELDRVFYAGHGGEEGAYFTVWTNARVYFPVCYDGAEWPASVARHPDGKPAEHVGGG